MLTALVLICSILDTPNLRDCDETNARVVMVAPEAFASPITCAMHGQAYIAETAVGQNLADSDRIKIVCRQQRPSEPSIAERDREAFDKAQNQRARLPGRNAHPAACERPMC